MEIRESMVKLTSWNKERRKTTLKKGLKETLSGTRGEKEPRVVGVNVVGSYATLEVITHWPIAYAH